MLLLVLASAASMATAQPVGAAMPISFDLNAVRKDERSASGSRKWLPPRLTELPDDDDDRPMFRFKGNKVKLRVPI